jgi:hypothetical protein
VALLKTEKSRALGASNGKRFELLYVIIQEINSNFPQGLIHQRRSSKKLAGSILAAFFFSHTWSSVLCRGVSLGSATIRLPCGKFVILDSAIRWLY